MKALLGSIYIIFFTFSSFLAQTNIIINGGFETHTDCPDMQSATLISMATGWQIPGGGISGSPDYFHTCAPASTGLDVPNNVWTYQEPRSGQAYAGVITYTLDEEPSMPNTREYIVYKFANCPLKAGKQYSIGFYMCTANHTKYATNNIGMKLTDSLPMTGVDLLENPQLEFVSPNGAYIDTLNWVLVADTVTAVGNERYVILGSFRNNASSSITTWEPTNPLDRAYFLIDDVYLYDLDPQPESHVDFLGTDTTLCPTQTVVIDASQIPGDYNWSTGATESEITVSSEGNYSVTIHLENGCFMHDVMHVDYLQTKDYPCYVRMELPNVFTPNSDGINDFFQPVQLYNILNYRIKIFNRWGELIFESDEQHQHWDGTYNGLPCTNGVYFWQFEATDYYQRNSIFNGIVELMR